MESELQPTAGIVTRMDILAMSMLMQPGDVREAMASGYSTPFDALTNSVSRSKESWSVYSRDGRMLAIFGLVDGGAKWAMPWMVVSSVMSENPVTLLRITRDIVGDWAEELSLFNWVHVDNLRSKVFLEVLGFTLEEPGPMPGGVPGEKFHLFWMGDRPCVS